MNRKIVAFLVFAVLFLVTGVLMSRSGMQLELRAMLNGHGPRDDAPAGDETWRFSEKKSDGAGTYFLYEPENIKDGEKMPLVVVLHGAPGRAYAAAHLVEPQVQRDYPSFVLIPTAPWNKFWIRPGQEDASVAALPGVMDLIAQLQKDYPVDPARLYIIGCSDGGTGTFGALARHPDTFAAAVEISGMWDLGDAEKMTGTPLWVMNGARDEIIPPEYGRDIAARVKDRGGDATYTEYEHLGHACSSDFYYTPSVWGWLFSHRR